MHNKQQTNGLKTKDSKRNTYAHARTYTQADNNKNVLNRAFQIFIMFKKTNNR